MALFKKKQRADPEAEKLKSFLDMIAPSLVKFEFDRYFCGNSIRCVWALREYPTATDDQAILRHLGEMHGVTLHVYTRIVTPVSYTHLKFEAWRHPAHPDRGRQSVYVFRTARISGRVLPVVQTGRGALPHGFFAGHDPDRGVVAVQRTRPARLGADALRRRDPAHCGRVRLRHINQSKPVQRGLHGTDGDQYYKNCRKGGCGMTEVKVWI